MPVNHPSPLLNAQYTGSGSLRSITCGRNSGLARSTLKENIHPINSKASPRVTVVRAATQTGISASKSKRRSAVRMRMQPTGEYLSPTAGVRPFSQRPEGFAKSGLANSPCISKSTKTARTPLRTVSNVSTGQITPTKMDAEYRVKTPAASEIVVYPCTPTSKPTSSPPKSHIICPMDTTSSPDVFTMKMPTSPKDRLSQDTPPQTTKTSLPSSPLPSFVLCSPAPIKNTRRTSLPAPRRSSPPPPASRRLSLPTRSVTPADPLPSFITIEAVILPLARPRRPTSIMTTSASNQSRSRSKSRSGSGSVREGMIAASVNRLADLVSVLDNCERRIDEALGTTTRTGIESGLDSGLVATGGECTTTFDSDSSMDSDSDGIRTPVGSVDDVGELVNLEAEEEKGPTFEYYWDADGDLVRKDPATLADSDVALEECLEKEMASRECLKRARELVRMRMERRDVY